MIAYAILGEFILIAVFISNRLVKIFGWSLSPIKLFLFRVGVFFGIFFILFFDHIIGMIQFKYSGEKGFQLFLGFPYYAQ